MAGMTITLGTDMVVTLGVWFAVFLNLGIFTMLYKENPWFRIAESVYLGLAVGYGVAFDLRYIRDQFSGKWGTGGYLIAFVLAFLIGALWYMRFFKQYFYLYRWPLAIVVGTGLGLALRTVIFSQFADQIRAQVRLVLWNPANMLQSVNNTLIFLMTPAVLLYFWFTGSGHEAPGMKYVDKFARYTMMMGFGVSFGNTVLTRYSLFIGRGMFLLGITEPLAYTPFLIFATLMLGTMIYWDMSKKDK